MGIKSVRMGDWVLNISEETEGVSEESRKILEQFLNEKYLKVAMDDYRRDYIPNYSMNRWGIPAPVVRLDMALMMDHRIPVYEIEANVSGLGIMDTCFPQIPIVESVADALHSLGEGRIGYGVTPCRHEQEEDLNLFMQSLEGFGVRTKKIDVSNGFDRSIPLWLRSGQEDIELFSRFINQCLLLHYHGGGHKNYLRVISETKLLSEFNSSEDVFCHFTRGFALKPIGGWGTRNVKIWTPVLPWKKQGHGRAYLKGMIERILSEGEGDEWLVQEIYLPRESGKNRFRIWRLFAVWNGDRFELIGGAWSERRSLLNHGASDTVMGPLYLS